MGRSETMQLVLDINRKKGIFTEEEDLKKLQDEDMLFYFNQILSLNSTLEEDDPVLLSPGLTIDQVLVEGMQKPQKKDDLEIAVANEDMHIEGTRPVRMLYVSTEIDPNNQRQIVESITLLLLLGYSHLYQGARSARKQLADSISYDSIPQVAIQQADGPLSDAYRCFKKADEIVDKLATLYTRRLMNSDHVLKEGAERTIEKRKNDFDKRKTITDFSRRNVYQLLHLMVQCVTKYYKK